MQGILPIAHHGQPYAQGFLEEFDASLNRQQVLHLKQASALASAEYSTYTDFYDIICAIEEEDYYITN